MRPSLSAPRLLAAVGLGGAGFDLTAAGEAAMGDSEADAARRRLLATLLSLQPFLRDIPAPSAAAAAAQPLPLGEADLQRERQSAAVLAAQCRQRLDAMPTTAETDEALLAADGSGGGGEALGVRRRQAMATRLEGKRLLVAAAEALESYERSLA